MFTILYSSLASEGGNKMLITKYICDRCGKEIEFYGAYSVEIKPINRPDYMQCRLTTMTTHHMCLECAKSIFDINDRLCSAKNTPPIVEGGE